MKFFFLLDPAIVPTQIPGYSPVTQSNYRFVFIIQAFDLFSIFECLLWNFCLYILIL